jgi:hypothetical protein
MAEWNCAGIGLFAAVPVKLGRLQGAEPRCVQQPVERQDQPDALEQRPAIIQFRLSIPWAHLLAQTSKA